MKDKLKNKKFILDLGTKKFFGLFFIFVFSFFAFSACGKEKIELKTFSAVNLHTELQQKALEAGYKEVLTYAQGMKELSAPEPVHLFWEMKNSKNGTPRYYVLTISLEEDLSNRWEYIAIGPSFNVYNLYLGETYYWQVKAVFADGELTSEISSFTVDDKAPRNLYVEGVTNVRDLGAWTTADGKKVKQGMIIRSAKMNENKKDTVLITDNGMETMLIDFAITTEIDFREGEILTESVLGPDVNYINIPMSGTVVNASNVQTIYPEIVRFFDIISDESNYPVLMHCSVGTDRTGLFAFLINGLLGVSEEDLYTDYTFSNFGHISSLRRASDIQDTYVAFIKTFEGNTLSEKIRNFLLQAGVSGEKLDKVCELMVE